MLNSLWNTIAPFYTQLICLGISLLGIFVVWLCRVRVRLIFGRANNSLNRVQVPDPQESQNFTFTEIYVEKYFLQNAGNKPATNVEFVLSDFPTDINVFQPRETSFVPVGKGNCMVKIPKIAPSELVIIDCVYINKQAGFITSVKCSEALGKEVPFQTVREFLKYVEYVALLGLVFGIAFVAQIVIDVF